LVRTGDGAEHEALYGFVKANQATYPVRVMCRLLGVSASGFYAWNDRPLSKRAIEDIALSAKIHAIHRHSRECYGVPRVHAELADDYGVHVGHKRVARLMRAAGLRGVTRRGFVRTTVQDLTATALPDLVNRHFRIDQLDQLWVADITYIPSRAGFLYLAIVLDACSRKVVGWAMENHLRTELVLEAINMALTQRRPDGVIHHSDRGTQYTSFAFGKRCQEMNVMPSVGSVGVPTIMRWPRASLRRLNVSCWIDARFARRRRRKSLCLNSSRVL